MAPCASPQEYKSELLAQARTMASTPVVVDPPHGAWRPQPMRGDWFRTSAALGGRCWQFPFSHALPVHGPPIRGDSGTYLGPVHDVDVTYRFTAIRVPHPEMHSLLVWVNVWSAFNARGEHRGVNFCNTVPSEEVQRWLQNGWRNFYHNA